MPRWAATTVDVSADQMRIQPRTTRTDAETSKAKENQTALALTQFQSNTTQRATQVIGGRAVDAQIFEVDRDLALVIPLWTGTVLNEFWTGLRCRISWGISRPEIRNSRTASRLATTFVSLICVGM